MISKEYFEAAVVAHRNEIDQLNCYVAERALSKSFRKAANRSLYGLPAEPARENPKWKVLPYHYLRTDLALLLGPSGSKLLNRTWAKYHLSPNEDNPGRLRPALMKLFSVAARIAAPKGVGHALKRIVGDFERSYFSVVEDPTICQHRKTSRRFALLSVLQSGQGSHLLHGILDSCESDNTNADRPDASSPSRLIERDPNVARRQFLFEAAFRAKSWSEAYRQARLLKKESSQACKESVTGKKMMQIFDGLHAIPYSPAKKKQMLTDLAESSEHSRALKLGYALEALAYPTLGCRPGDLERIVCQTVPAHDPWWKASLNRLYRHQAVPERWMEDFRALCRSEPSLRNFGRVLLNTLKYSSPRAQSSLERHQMTNSCLVGNRLKARMQLNKAKEGVMAWLELLPPMSSSIANLGAKVELRCEQWRFVAEVCSMLDIEAPVSARTCYQPQPITMNYHQGQRVLSLHPDFLSCCEQEQRFMMARALFRGAAGLDHLERRASSLSSPMHILDRVLSYAEWSGHSKKNLEELLGNESGADALQVALEEMYWETEDNNYQRFALLLQHGGWCPLFDRESDLFAASFVNIVDATHALSKVGLWGKQLSRICSREGLSHLLKLGPQHPVLCLRLQTLWMAAADNIQRD